MWEEHFEFHGPLIVGLTDVAAATVRLLRLNTDERLQMRAELLATGQM